MASPRTPPHNSFLTLGVTEHTPTSATLISKPRADSWSSDSQSQPSTEATSPAASTTSVASKFSHRRFLRLSVSEPGEGDWCVVADDAETGSLSPASVAAEIKEDAVVDVVGSGVAVGGSETV